MLDFLKNNWGWLIVAVCIVVSVLTVMKASKRKDSDFVDSQTDDEEVKYNHWGIPEKNNRA